jgi:hypothetical protein
MVAFGQYLVAATVCVAAVWPTLATAQTAPSELRGKSIIASWSETRLQRLGDEKEFSQRSFPMKLSAYVSSEGRVFAKRVVSSGRGGNRSGSVSSVGENQSGGQTARFSGRNLNIFSRFSGGARMVRIDFDQSFSSCQANIVLGRENGTGTMRSRSLISGANLEIQSSTISGASCAVQSGNVFGE